MPDIDVRKRVTIVEEIFHEGGPIAKKPLKRAPRCSDSQSFRRALCRGYRAIHEGP